MPTLYIQPLTVLLTSPCRCECTSKVQITFHLIYSTLCMYMHVYMNVYTCIYEYASCCRFTVYIYIKGLGSQDIVCVNTIPTVHVWSGHLCLLHWQLWRDPWCGLQTIIYVHVHVWYTDKLHRQSWNCKSCNDEYCILYFRWSWKILSSLDGVWESDHIVATGSEKHTFYHFNMWNNAGCSLYIVLLCGLHWMILIP